MKENLCGMAKEEVEVVTIKIKNIYSNPILAICLGLVGISRITTFVAYPQGFQSPDTMIRIYAK